VLASGANFDYEDDKEYLIVNYEDSISNASLLML